MTKEDDYLKGWIIDAQLSDDGTGMDVWMYVANTGVRHLVIPWSASIHVHATKERLNNLANWLDFAEIRQRFGVGDEICSQSSITGPVRNARCPRN